MNIEGNYEKKYQTKHPIKKWLVNRFLAAFREIISENDFQTALDAGCGEGDLLKIATKIKTKTRFSGFDLSPKIAKICQQQNPKVKIRVADICRLPYPTNQFDFVFGCEIIEHLKNPSAGLKELARVGKKRFLITVPFEPWWRWLNFIRFRYWFDLGNTPGHLQHFNRHRINKLVTEAGLKVIRIKIVFPWLFVTAEK